MIGVGFATLSAVAYAFTSVLVRRGARTGPADNGLLLTTLTNVVILAVSAVIVYEPIEFTDATMRGLLCFASSGVLASFLGRGSLFGGITRIGPARSASLKNTSPIFGITVAVVVLGEDVSFVGGIAIGIVASALVLLVVEAWRQTRFRAPVDLLATDASLDGIVAEELSTPSPRLRGLAAPLPVGVVLSLAAAVFFGTGQVIRKVGISYLPEAVLGALVASVASLLVYLLGLSVRGQLSRGVRETLRTSNLSLFGAGVASTVGILGFFGAIHYLPVAYVATIVATESIFTVVLSRVMLGRRESVTFLVAVGCCMVFVGAALLALSVRT